MKSKAHYLILIDTNFLMMPFYKRVNPFESIEDLLKLKPKYVVLSSTLDELKRISSRDIMSKEGRAAKFGLELARRYEIGVIEDATLPGDTTDDKIVEYVKKTLSERKLKIIVATNDRELKRRLRALGVPVVIYRERDHRIWLNGEV